MVQLFIHSISSTFVIPIETNQRVCDLKHSISLKEGVPPQSMNLSFQGKKLENDEYTLEDYGLSQEDTIRVGLLLLGGKGGYGALLREKSKRCCKKKTTYFGACRDLSGRRLEHVNNAIILQKWKDAKENGQEFDPEAETPTGIENWHLPTPTWVDPFKPNRRKAYLKERLKTELCIDWVRAREEGEPPEGAPVWWGCPRGLRCQFAHGEGEGELRGKRLEERVRDREEAEREEREKGLADYLAPMGGDSSDIVLAGLRKAKEEASKEVEEGMEEEKEGGREGLDQPARSITSSLAPSLLSPSLFSSNPSFVSSSSFSELPLDDWLG